MLKRLNERTVCIGVFVGSFLLNAIFSLVGLKHDLFEIHVFRQLQTALTTRAIQEGGWSLAYPTPLFGPPWSAPMEFPLYEWCVAALGQISGMPLQVAGRLVAVGFLYLALPACAELMKILGVSSHRRWLFPALILLSPAYVYYSRSFMIESTALCTSAWFLLGYCRAIDGGGRRWVAIAAAAGALAATAKVTTFAIFLSAAACQTAWIFYARRRDGKKDVLQNVARAALCLFPAFAAAIGWVYYSDYIKGGNPLTVPLTSQELRGFNLGTLAQRISGEFWQRILNNASVAIMPVANIGLVVLFAVILGRKHRLRSITLLAIFAAGPLVFANLYFVHDYYFYANGIFLLAALVLAWSQLLDVQAFSFSAKWTVVGVSLAIQLLSYVSLYLPAQRHELEQPPELGSVLKAATKPEDILLIFGQDWDARVPYGAHRRAIMITDKQANNWAAINTVLDRVPPGSVTALIVSGKLRQYPAHFGPLIERLDLHPQASLLNKDTMVYFAKDRIDQALSALELNPPATFKFSAGSVQGDAGVARTRFYRENFADQKMFSMMHPSPVQVIHPFTPDALPVDGELSFNAHAPTDIIFNVPPGAREVFAAFGILSAAYEGKNQTDGVEFRVDLVSPDGVRRRLHSVYLSPSFRTADRGAKNFRVQLPANAQGQLWLRTLPGATGSISCGWGYWSKIEVK